MQHLENNQGQQYRGSRRCALGLLNGIAAIALALPAFAQAQETFKIRFAHSLSSTEPPIWRRSSSRRTSRPAPTIGCRSRCSRVNSWVPARRSMK